MTPDDFRRILDDGTDADLLDISLRDGVSPYVFESKKSPWQQFREYLGGALGVTPNDIRIVGSGRLGFSMKPGKDFRKFRDESDIDLVVVNAARFDELWLALLDAAYPRGATPSRLGGWLAERRNEVYTGWLSPLEIKLDPKIYGEKARRVLQFNLRWFNTLKEASKFALRRHEDVTGRLYRTWEHADFYHLSSLSDLRASLET